MSKLTKQIQRLFPQFRDYKAKLLNPNTIDRYDDYIAILNRLPIHIDKPAEVRDWLLKKYAPETCRRVLQHVEACYTWAVGSDLAKDNPFTKLPNLPKKAYNRRNAFSQEERDRILEAFKTWDPYWEPFVWFLFKTGCRFEEAVGLQRRHVSNDCKTIHFQQAIASSGRITPIKTGEARRFPCNPAIQARLKILIAGKADNDWMFPTTTGNHITASSFLHYHWGPLVKSLCAQGRIVQYLPQSHTRHTFITLALASKMDVQDIAAICGNSAGTIYKHYASVSQSIDIPDF
jgi:integrase